MDKYLTQFKGENLYCRLNSDNNIEVFSKETHIIDNPEFIWGIGKNQEIALINAKEQIDCAKK